ncbi:hypothetical protein ACJJTC_006577 [Scirpophaga incertulas]
MNIYHNVSDRAKKVEMRLRQNSFASLLDFVNFVPKLLGFPLMKDKIFAPFWIMHLCLLLYVYVTGTLVYLINFAHSAGDFIKSYVNISLFIFVVNDSYWFLSNKQLLKATLQEINLSDQLATINPIFRKKHERLVLRIKLILFLFYGFNMTNAFFIYVPHRINVQNNYAMTPCYGMEPITSSPKKEICQTILFFQEFNIVTIVLSYQSLLLFVIAHTTLLFQLLSDDIMTLNNYDKTAHFNNPLANELLPVLIRRHTILLGVINKLKALYSGPIGVDFASDAVCISLFFYLPLQEWLQFMPLLTYCFLAFFLYCFLCQRLTNSAELFERSVYACGWENFGVKEKRAVFIILRQAQQPVEILAANIIPVNISTFATTLQAMFKFVTVIKV